MNLIQEREAAGVRMHRDGQLLNEKPIQPGYWPGPSWQCPVAVDP
jgi:hypothetical protein